MESWIEFAPALELPLPAAGWRAPLLYAAHTCNISCMKQLYLNVTAEFERDLQAYMESHSLSRKSEAIRQALREASARSAQDEEYDFRSWLGWGLRAPLRRKRRFRSEEDLWS